MGSSWGSSCGPVEVHLGLQLGSSWNQVRSTVGGPVVGPVVGPAGGPVVDSSQVDSIKG